MTPPHEFELRRRVRLHLALGVLGLDAGGSGARAAAQEPVRQPPNWREVSLASRPQPISQPSSQPKAQPGSPLGSPSSPRPRSPQAPSSPPHSGIQSAAHAVAASALSQPRDNPYAAWPSSPGFGLYLEVELAFRGQPDPITGYLVDIGTIDAFVREVAIRELSGGLGPAATPGVARVGAPATLLRTLLSAGPARFAAAPATATVQLTPFYGLSMDARQPQQVLLRQSFEFSASHRLHCPEFDDAKNHQLFGKCNNPNGHGHNYRVEVAVACPLDERDSPRPGLHAIESIVRERVIDRFDHKHLNSDVAEFRTLNPSVENIAATAHRLLEAPLGAAGGALRAVTVWETEKTCCTYPAPSQLG